MNYILFDDAAWKNLLPLTYTKPVSEIRIGILTITEKWEKYLDEKISFQTQSYLSEKYRGVYNNDTIFINGKICPTKELINEIKDLTIEKGIRCGNTLVAFRSNSSSCIKIEDALFESKETELSFTSINNVWDIFSKNGEALKFDFDILTKNRKSLSLSNSNTVIGNREDIFLEEGAVVEASILNTKSGPIYIGKDAEVMEGSIIRGPFALCEHSTIKMAAKIYGPTTIFNWSRK